MNGELTRQHRSGIENYEQAIEYLYSRINYERVPGNSFSVSEFRLDRMRELLRRLGNPQESIPAVHIAGTKGKGSTAAMIASCLQQAGIVTGLFTSPHITAFEERIVVNGRQATPGQIVELVNQLLGLIAELDEAPGDWSPTYFEIATAMAWLFFRQSGVQLAVLEVGLGGRLDATTVCRPLVTIITSISRDHTRQLGSRLDQIAREKGGIIKPGVPLINGATQPNARQAIEEIARDVGAPLLQLGVDFTYVSRSTQVPGTLPLNAIDVCIGQRVWDKVAVSLSGEHQAHNLAVALTALELLRTAGWDISETAIRQGLAELYWPGRIEVLAHHPLTIVDTAHNWASIQALLRTLDQIPARRRILVFAATKDKDVAGMLRQVTAWFDTIVMTSYVNNPRGVPVAELERLTQLSHGATIHIATDAASAWKMARRLSGPDDLICVTGSFFIAAELRDVILDVRDESGPSA